uniref:AlNc14C421G11528 protein n=1 Tax=Albugo laibachii Nc14 TaxID=890382 RepID=F0WZC5_9STRA|nr:AlNc14C421G11528 [Albugo laibachii Nc14]|eukprot:CCA26843.1 AlNc14C421G11528 [Albugo laibachii Nc14]
MLNKRPCSGLEFDLLTANTYEWIAAIQRQDHRSSQLLPKSKSTATPFRRGHSSTSKKRSLFKSTGSQRRRAPGGDSKPVLRELEDIIFDQVLYSRSNKEKVSRKWIQETARAMVTSDLHTPEFAASDK